MTGITADKLSPKVFELCHSATTLTSELAKNPHEAPTIVCQRLYQVSPAEDDIEDNTAAADIAENASDIEQARRCGNWGDAQPSDLFLKIYHGILQTLEDNPLNNLCSPPLIGTTGVCPIFINSTIPDIARHMSNLIARAEHEVFLATNFWMISEAVKLISDALTELSRQAGREGRRRVVKIMYDRGSAKQFMNNHLPISPEEYADPNGKIQLPHPKMIPNIDLEVQNYHRPLLGTFHAKFMIVDRKIAVVQSDNIQDNDNLELMAQLEGSVVDSLYETALISWGNAMQPPLPCVSLPSAAEKGVSCWAGQDGKAVFDDDGTVREKYRTFDASKDTARLPPHTSSTPHYDTSLANEVLRSISNLQPSPNDSPYTHITRLLNSEPSNITLPSPTLPPPTPTIPSFSPLNLLPPHTPIPIALASRPPHPNPTLSSLSVPQNAAFLCALSSAAKSVYIQSPDINAQDLLQPLLSTIRRGIHVELVYCLGYNDAGEMLPLQGGHNEYFAHELYRNLNEKEKEKLDVYVYIAKDQMEPIHNSRKARSCHVKLMIVDDQVAVLGSGNQDSQSWYHSCEVNVVIDSAMVVGRLGEVMRGNQNSWVYGACEKGGELMGCWVDGEGKMAVGSQGPDGGRFSWFRGAVGAVQRVRGVGGF